MSLRLGIVYVTNPLSDSWYSLTKRDSVIRKVRTFFSIENQKDPRFPTIRVLRRSNHFQLRANFRWISYTEDRSFFDTIDER